MEDKPQHTSDDEPCKLPYEFIKKITNDFDKKQILGSGGFGTVYKGVHDTRGRIAVKVLHNMSGLDDKEFHKEFNNLRGLKHQNIVELVGFCKESEEELAEFDGKQVTATRLHMALCFEYVHNGSLDKHISDEYTGFNWPTRYGIIKGICEGLKYLREGLESPIMHFDLKPDNILLNKNMVPKIADFGLSELFGKDNTTKAVNSVGTCGYWPPEYINHQIISREFDIFSLGVIIVKIMTGHGGYNSIVEMMTQKSVKLVHESWKKRIHKTVSHTLFEVYSHQVKRCIEIALDCLKSNRHERPTIHDIVSSLNETETIIGERAMHNEQFYQENGEPTLPCENSSITIDCGPSSGNGQDSMSTHTGNFLHMEPRAMPFCVLKKITDDFSRERLLSRHRRYGHVFKGVCEDGQVIIVRTFGVRRGFEETNMQELVTLVKVHHQNIVQLVGYCWEKKEIVVPCEGRYVYAPRIRTFMCFEYLPNGSLDRYISEISSGLDWHTRYGIIKGICAGLKCLHEGLNNPGIHMNLKLSNILLDENMMPKISKFGIQTILGEEKGRSTDDIHPSDLTPDDHRHMPPEFIQRQVISKAFDIYSLGVIVIELMTGTRLGFLDTNLLEISSEEFIEQAQEEWRQRLQKTVHVTLVEGYCKQVVKCLEIGLKCVERDRHSRPAITNIVNMLNETETFIRSEWLDVYPRNLCFGPMMWRWEPYKKSMFSCTLELKNKGNDRIAFMLVAKNPKKYLTKKPLCGIVPPRCAYILTVTMMPHTQNMPLDINDFFTLYSIAVSQYDLPDVKKDSILVQYSNFFKAKEKVARDEVQEVKLKVYIFQIDDFAPPKKKQKRQADHARSSEVTATPDAQQVSFIDAHPTEPWIMTTNHMGSLRLWNYKTMPDSLLVYKGGLMQMEMLNYSQLVAYEPVHTAKFIARERWLIAGDRNGDIHVYNYNQNQHVKSFDAHNSCITILSVHPTDPFFLSSSDDDDHLIKLWNWKKEWECTRTFQGHTDSVTEVTFNPENKDSFASASSDGTVKIWSICSYDLCNIITLKLDGLVESLLSIDYFTRYNRQHLIVGSKGRSAQIWKLRMTGCVDMLEGHADTISAVNSHPEFPMLITGSLDGTVRIWNSTTYKLENIIGFNLGAVYALGCITGTRRIVAGCHQGIGTMELSPP